MSSYPIRNRLNLFLTAAVVAMNLIAWLFAPYWFSTTGVIWFLLFDLIAIRLTNIHWHLIHEAAHGVLAQPRQLNEALGHIMSVLFNSSFAALRQGHLMHHRVNRIADVTDVYFEKGKPNRLAYYVDILGGFFLVFCFIFPITALFGKKNVLRIVTMMEKKNQNHPSIGLYQKTREIIAHSHVVRETRRQMIWALLFMAVSLFVYLSHGLGLVWLGYFLLRAVGISYLNNMPHYRNTLNDNMASDTAYLPKVLARCYLNFNYHKTHHLHPRAPWHVLPQLFEESGGEFDCHYIKAYLHQLRGPVYAEELRE